MYMVIGELGEFGCVRKLNRAVARQRVYMTVIPLWSRSFTTVKSNRARIRPTEARRESAQNAGTENDGPYGSTTLSR